MIYFIDLLGTLVFAISGALTASNNRFDVFGCVVIAFVTAVGGGTLRDLLLDIHPLGWMVDLNYIIVVIVAVLLALIFKNSILKLRKTMFLFDSIGIGLFTVIGIEKTLELGLTSPIALIMGVISAVFGGVIRDILTNIAPLIFRKEFYATACLVGGMVYLTLRSFELDRNIILPLSVLIISALRIIAVKRKWSLELR